MTNQTLKWPKVFGIGFHKTATTSLAAALHQLGYTVTGPNGIDNPNIARDAWSLALDLSARFDAFQDNPWPILYRQLDAKFPGSKFILTIRPTHEWLKSVVRHFGHEDTPMRKWIYGEGHPAGNEDIYVARFEKHNQDVIEHFKDHPLNLLVMDITSGDGWDKLCPFLAVDIPQNPFPQTNTALQRESRKNPIGRLLGKFTRRV